MRVTCPSCQTNYNIDDKRVPPGGAKLKCAKCQTTFPIRPAGEAVPLPGISAAPTRPAAVPLPGVTAPRPRVPEPSWEDAATRVATVPAPPEASGAVPLPGGGGAPDDVGFADADLVEPPGGGAVPLPGDDPGAVDFGDTSLPPPPAAGAPNFNIDFGEPPPPASDRTQTAPGPVDFSDLPSPADPPPATDFNVDFGAPPPPSAPASAPLAGIGFGEVDFGDSGAPARAPSAPAAAFEDPLEFDPTANKGPRDDLEADLSAPIPAAPVSSSSSAADGLEMLNFIDDAAKSSAGPKAAKVKRYHVRRRSGKVFGPFDEGVVIKMMEDGQLLGNEDVSPDGDSWSPMATVASFGQAIQKLMESPSAVAGARGVGGMSADGGQSASSAQSMEKLKQLYGGRMAAVAVVDRRDSEEKLKKRLPIMIGAGAIALVLLIGLSFSFTRYGAFGIKKLLPSKVSKSSVQYADLQAAKKALLTDTFKSYQEARDLTGKVLSAKEYPEVRVVWCQAIYYLQRRYAASTPAERQRADAALPDIELLGTRNVEVAKALAGSLLAGKRPREALPILLEAKSRSENDADTELNLLLAETYAAQAEPKQAEDALNKVLARDPSSAKALHALGNLHQAANNAKKAADAYAKALQADPQHVSSAVELAAVELLVNKDMAGGEKSLREALADKSKNLMGPAEQARAKALLGVLYAAQFKPAEASRELDEAAKLDPDSVFAKAMLGRVLIGRREFARALPLYKEATEKEPSNLEYTQGYLQTLIATGKMSDALNAVQAANSRFPGNARIAYLFGTVSDALDNATEAEGHFKRAVSADPELYEANLALARFYLRFRRFTEARPQLEIAAKKAPNDAGVHAGLGELALAEDNADAAQQEFEKSVSLDPNLADAHLGISRVAFNKGEHDASLAEVEKALALDPDLKGSRLQRAEALWKLGRIDESIAELERAKQADPKSAAVAITTGAVKYDKGDLPGAEAALLTALSLEQANPEAHFYMARVKAKRAEYAQAIDSMKNALEHATKRSDYHYEMGLIYRDAKKFQEALEEWRVATSLDPKNADAFEALGQLLLDRGDIDGAVAAFDRALAADPDRKRILGLVGDAYFQAAKWDQAIGRYNMALKADKTLVQIYYKLGRAYAEKGQPAKALGYYVQSSRLDGHNPMPFYYLGYANKERGKRADAITAFRQYLKLKPDADDRKEIEDEIYDLEH